MEKNNLAKQFAHHLRDAMINVGFTSHRSTSGVSIHKLVEITGYSIQICRKYLRGEAIPEPTKLIDIAEKLKVSPGWLLFGSIDTVSDHDKDCVLISRTLLHYIFSKAIHLYGAQNMSSEVPNFLLDLVNDLHLINATEEQSKKIIDLAIASVMHFNH